MPIAMLRNRLAHHLTSWSLWHGLLALLAILLGSQLQVIVELGAGLPAHWQAALRMLATPLQLIGRSCWHWHCWPGQPASGPRQEIWPCVTDWAGRSCSCWQRSLS